jgi:glycosyltransferase involved in cell wall biosynthesis
MFRPELLFRIVGRVPVEAVNQYYAAASIFCMPTHHEPFGIAFIEALSHALPIVATDIGAIPDFVVPGKNGYLIKPGDVRALAGALSDLLGHPQRCRDFGAASYQIAKDRYTWEKVGAAIRENVLATLSAL